MTMKDQHRYYSDVTMRLSELGYEFVSTSYNDETLFPESAKYVHFKHPKTYKRVIIYIKFSRDGSISQVEVYQENHELLS